jgi:hypothetical protein
MLPLWFGLLGGSFVFLDVGPSILIFVFPLFFGCFGFTSFSEKGKKIGQ